MFEPDLWIFQKYWNWKKRKDEKKALSSISEHAVYLKDIELRLAQVAYALTQNKIKIKKAENHGSIQDTIFYLPEKIDLLPSQEKNIRAYILRLALSSKILDFVEIDKLFYQTISHIELSLLAMPTVLRETFTDYPSLRKDHIEFLHSHLNHYQEIPLNIEKEFYHNWLRAIIENHSTYFPIEFINSSIKTKKQLINLYNNVQLYKKDHNYNDQMIDFFYPVFWPSLPTFNKSVMTIQVSPTTLQERDSLPSGTEKEAPAKESFKQVTFHENDEEAMPVTHVLEKVTTADIFDGGIRTIDGSDELNDHFETLNELDIREVVRTNKKTQSIYKANISYLVEFEDSQDDIYQADFLYDEWNHKTKKYMKNWCGLKQHIPSTDSNDFASQADYMGTKQQIIELRRVIEKILMDKKKRNKQYDGSEVDIDSVTDWYAELKAGISKTDKLYTKKRNVNQDAAVVLLLDASLSTDSWVQGRRVMDVIKESVYILSKVCNGLSIQVAFFGFYSNTRRDCHYITIKDFQEPWSTCHQRIKNLEPTGYTRIGPALRHSNYLLKNTKKKKKTLILLSDGKPTDYDAYEGIYGVEDVRQALRESKSLNINIQSLVIDKQTKTYFPQMFGKGNYEVLSSSQQLPLSLVKIFSKLI